MTWAKLIPRVYEVDPLLCPFCGAEMKILAFILDFGTARTIRKSFKLPAQEPEPLAHAPPQTLELIAESAGSCGGSSSQNPPDLAAVRSRLGEPGTGLP